MISWLYCKQHRRDVNGGDMTSAVSSTQLHYLTEGGGHHRFSRRCKRDQQWCCLIWRFLPLAVATSAVHRLNRMAIPAHLRLPHDICRSASCSVQNTS